MNPTTIFQSNASSIILQFELDRLFERINYERTTIPLNGEEFKLDFMRSLLDKLGNPQNRYRIVHVAGTKGKGTVCQMIAAGVCESGRKTGRYSSPHIERINERIEFNGQLISDDELAGLLLEVRQVAEQLTSRTGKTHSFFEIVTAAALLHFAKCKAEFVVLEVGLGGRLDSTNVCQPELCVITNISLDHTRQLGDTVDKIAFEKAGIIKPGVPVISGATDPVAAKVIRQACAERGSPLAELDRDFECRIEQVDPKQFQLTMQTSGALSLFCRNQANRYKYDSIIVKGVGRHVATNAAIATAALQTLRTSEPRINESAIRRGLGKSGLPGRCEILFQSPLIIVDMAHNVASTGALVETLRLLAASRTVGIRRLIFAVSHEKDVAGILRQLLPEFDEVYITRYVLNPRAHNPADIEKVVRQCLAELKLENPPSFTIAENPTTAWQTVSSAAQSNDLIAVAGSAFLITEIKPLVKALPTSECLSKQGLFDRECP